MTQLEFHRSSTRPMRSRGDINPILLLIVGVLGTMFLLAAAGVFLFFGRTVRLANPADIVVTEEPAVAARPTADMEAMSGRIAELETEVARVKRELEAEKTARQTAERLLEEQADAFELASSAGGQEATDESADPSTGESSEVVDARMKLAEAIKGEGVMKVFGSPGFNQALKRMKETLGQEGLDDLLAALSAGSSQEQLSAALLLEGWNNPAAIPALELANQNADDLLVQRFSAHALAMIDGDEQIPVLQRIIDNEEQDAGARVNAAFGLAKRGEDAGMKFMIDLARSEDLSTELRPAIFPAIVMAAEEVSPDVVLPFLHENLTPDATMDKVYIALSGLEKIGDQSSLPTLEGLLTGGHPESIKDQARKVINRIVGYDKYDLE